MFLHNQMCVYTYAYMSPGYSISNAAEKLNMLLLSNLDIKSNRQGLNSAVYDIVT